MGKGRPGRTEELEDDELAQEFFSSAPPPPRAEEPVDGWEPEPMGRGERRAMIATLVMLGACGLSLLSFGALAEVAIVQPAALGQQRGLMPVAQLDFGATDMGATDLGATEGPVRAPASATFVAHSSQERALPARNAVEGETGAGSGAEAGTDSETGTEAGTDSETDSETGTETGAGSGAEADSETETGTDSETGTEAGTVAGAGAGVKVGRRVRGGALRGAKAAKPASDAAALTKNAYRALNGGNAAQAASFAQRALQLDPTDAGSYIVLGGARDALGDTAGAHAAFRLCLARASGSLVSACKTLAR